MKSAVCKVSAALALFVCLLAGNVAYACSWAAYHNGQAAVVVRTMDWYYDDNMVVKGHGRNLEVKAGSTANAVTYTSKYASIQLHSFPLGIVAEAMNEKGLQASLLYLDNTEIPAPQADRKDLDQLEIIRYIVSNFATVQEVVVNLPQINFVASNANVLNDADGKPIQYKPGHMPFHFAMVDAGGDKAIVEFWQGQLKIYHGKEHNALTNEPNYDVHATLDQFGYVPNGSIQTIDRRARARLYMQDMLARKVSDPQRALLAMRGLLATVYAGTEELDPVDIEVYPTIWGCLADQNSLTYYVSRYNTWCWEIYDFTMFDPNKPEVVTLKAEDCPYAGIEVK